MTIIDTDRLRLIAEVEYADIVTWPSHFHNGNESNVIGSHLSREPEIALREFLGFVRQHLGSQTKAHTAPAVDL